MNDEDNLRTRVAILEAELAGAAGMAEAIAAHFERNGEDVLADFFHVRAAAFRKLVGVKPMGVQQ